MQIRSMVVFPGQGAQYTGMLGRLSGDYDKAEYFVKTASEISGLDLSELCERAGEDELTLTHNAQPALLLSEYIAYRRLTENYELSPVFFAGHSLGEISALTCCGAIDFKDAVNLVTLRGRFMAKAQGGAMAAVQGVSPEQILESCEADGRVVISNYNSPTQIIISGLEEGIEEVLSSLEKLGARTTRLKVSGAFHSPYMKPAQEQLSPVLDEMNFNYFSAPVISNWDARPYCSPELTADRLKKQLVSSVRWTDTVQYAVRMGVNTVIEIGPGTVLKNLILRNEPKLEVYSVDDAHDLERLQSVLPPRKVKGCDYARIVRRSMGIAVCIKNENDREADYQKGVIEPYRRLQKMKSDMEEGRMEPSPAAARAAVEELKTIITTKGAGKNILRIRIHQLLREAGGLEEFSDLLCVN